MTNPWRPRAVLAVAIAAAASALHFQPRPAAPLLVSGGGWADGLVSYAAPVPADIAVLPAAGTARDAGSQRRARRPGEEAEHERRFDSPGEAALFRRFRQLDENGEIPDGALMRAKAQVDNLRAAQPWRPYAAGITRSNWAWLGPGNIGGRIRAVAIHPATTSTIFIGSVSGGIWKTTNSGAAWSVVDDFMANLAVTSIVFQPGAPSTMYASTGEGFINFDAIRGAGIFKSTDGGVNWAQLASTANLNFYYVNRLAFSANGSILLAATRDTGMWQSVDGGNLWTSATGDAAAMLDVKFIPGSNTLAVAGGRRNAYYSTDAGLTWTASASLTLENASTSRVEIGVSESEPGTVYLSTYNGTSLLAEVWKSTDSGVTYARTAARPSPSALGGQGWYDNAIWVDPTNPLRVVVGGTTLASTADGGATWTTRSYGVGIHPDQHAIVHDPGYNGTTNKRVYIGNDGGIYKTEDITTASFTSVAFTALNNNLGITQFYGAAGNATSGKIFGGTQDNGTLLYTPAGGTTWTLRVGGDGGYAAADPGDPNYLYGEYQNMGLHRNTSGGTSPSDEIYGWSDSLGDCKPAPYQITDACLSSPTVNFISPFILDPNNSNRLLAGGRSLWRTNDVKTANTATTGPTWSAIKAASGTNNINAIAVAPGNSDVIWVGHNGGGIFRTTDGTATAPAWLSRANGTPGRTVHSIAIDPANINTVYVSFAGFSANNLWKTLDGGATWASASGSGATALPSAPIYSVVVHPTIANWVYAGSEVGLFASTDGGATWSLPHDGPANVSVDELFWMGSSLVAVTHGRGVFMSTCGLTLSPTSASVANSGGGGTVTVTSSASGCAWAPSSNSSWLTTTGSGTGSGSFTWAAAANTGAARTGIITVGGTTFTVTQATAPVVTTDRASLTFGATNTGSALTNVTPAQTVTVTFAGGSSTWTATTASPWIQIGGGSGIRTGNGQFTVTVANAAGLPASGTVTGSIAIASSGVTNSPQTIAVSLTLLAPTTASAPPFGSFDTPTNGATGLSGSFAVTGWALDDVGIDRVEIWRDPVPGEPTAGSGPTLGKVFIANPLFVSGARTDVEATFGAFPAAYRAGWGYLLMSWGLANQGNGTYNLYAFAYDTHNQVTLLGSKTIAVNNAQAVKPFGGLDVPAYGDTKSGSFYNFGWALTPNPNTTDPRTCAVTNGNVFVGINSAPLVPVTYGDPRSDIAGFFPGFSNSDGPSGAYLIDTTTLPNGANQIGWYVVDNCGRADGIGSRIFNVLNSGATTPTPRESAAAERATAALIAASHANDAPIEVRRRDNTALVYPNSAGYRILPIAEGERVEVQLPAMASGSYQGFEVVKGERRRLPAGSSLDAAGGIFYWQPAPGFLGAHDLLFVASSDGADASLVRARVVVGTSVQAAIDAPQPGIVSAPFMISGWAIDQAAAEGTGIDTVHVWAYPATGAAPFFLGVAAYGDLRPDISGTYGDQFGDASYSLPVGSLAPGTYDIVVYPHSAVTGDFHGAKAVRVVVQ
jgi:hypothetical protein